MDHVEYLQKIAELLRMIDTKNAKISNKQSFPQNLTTPLVSILLLLNERGPIRVSDISSQLNMVDSNVSTLCTRLEKMDFVERVRLKDDQRVVKIQLTDAAQEKMESILTSVNECNKLILKHTTQEDLEKILVGLTALNQLFDNVLKEKSE